MAAANYEQILKSSLVKYKYADIAKRDVLNVFQQFKDLRPCYEAYIFNDGTKKDLLNLDGTIPVSYRGSVYNIPLSIYVLDTHPYNPPMVYVKPTSTMQIKQGRNVDANGKIDLPYLRDWKYPQSDLLGLIQVLVIVFGDDPPVFSKVQQQPPARPPYPPGGGGGNLPYPSQGSGFQMPIPGQPGAGQNPPYPSSGYPQSGPGFNQGREGNFGGYPPQQSYPSQGQGGFAGYPPSSYPSTQGYPSSYPQYPSQTTNTTTSSGVGQPGNTNTVTEEHLRISLLSAVEDKMKRRLREIFEQAQYEMNVLYQTQTDLKQGKEKLDQMITNLEQEKTEIENNISLLKDKDSEIQTVLEKLDNQSSIDIDEAVMTTTPLYKQLLNSFAEEQAIEDAIYYLGEALRQNVIDLDVFLKQVRDLSRKQFMLRALIQKCREKAELPPLA